MKSIIKTYNLKSSTILLLYSERDRLKLNPDYQRRGEIWNLDKRQLLIDSILNNYDIPKLYFHVLEEKKYDYAIIDGRQRMETIFQFIDGVFNLAEDFEFLRDSKVKAAGMKYEELAKKYPKLKIEFDGAPLPIICVETDDIDLIEDMFSRLNEAVPLNAAEKRNAFGGPMAKLIRKIAEHNFFKYNVKFSDKRFQHREVSARLLYLIYCNIKFKRIFDTKKIFMDTFVKEYRIKNQPLISLIENETIKYLDVLESIFNNKDTLLRSQAYVPIYFLLIKKFFSRKKDIKRKIFVEFQKALDLNREMAEKDISKAKYEYLEFDRLTQQGTNDASSIRERLDILGRFVSKKL